ncbi:hypothetical protein OTU49_013473 [Cherax quadricarinatus]
MLFTRQIEFESIGKSLFLSQESEGDTGCVVWDAAIVLAKYLEKQRYLLEKQRDLDVRPVRLSDCHVVELGSGTGCVGLTAALLGASKVTITDLPQLVPLMEKNILQNHNNLRCAVDAIELTWGNMEQGAALGTPDLLVLADCIYYEESLEPLVSTMRSLCGTSTTVILSYEHRTTGNNLEIQNRFFGLMEENFWKESIPLEDQHELYRSHDIHLFKFNLR